MVPPMTSIPFVPASRPNWHGQYVIGPADRVLPDGFERIDLGRFAVGAAAGLPHVPIQDRSGAVRGVVLGWLADPQRQVMETDRLEIHGDRIRLDWSDVEAALYRFAGSWIAVLVDPKPDPSASASAAGVASARVYLDADGTLPLVVDPETGAAASSAGLLFGRDRYVADFDDELYRHLDVRREGWFTAGLTAHRSLRRVLCNHYLDLDAGRSVRHWPTAPVGTTDDPVAATAALMAHTAGVVSAVQRSHRPVSSLTAGNETRFLLASCHDSIDDLAFFTIAPERGASLDVHTAVAMASRFGLDHRVLSTVHATAAEEAEWLYLGGHCVSGPNPVAHPTLRGLSDRDVLLTGLGGEIGRAFLWRKTDAADTPIDAAGINSRLGLPPHDRVIAAIDEWMTTLPDGDSHFLLDMAYLELRMSAWAYANPFGSGKEILHIAPMIGRASYDLMLSLPEEWKRNTRFIASSMTQGWPELAEFPINRWGDRRDVTQRIRQAAAEPHLIAKKLRKLMR